MTILKTPRLLLRRALPTDLDALHAILLDPMAMQYWSTAAHTTIDQTGAWLDSMMASPPDLSEDFIIEREGKTIGKVGFYRLPEIGFIIHRDYWGQGIAHEAARAAIDHVFATRDVTALKADVDPRNEASRKLLERLGFVETGFAERTFQIDGVWTDSIFLELRRSR